MSVSVNIENLTKEYRIYRNNKDRIKNFLSIYSNYDRNYVFFKYLFYTLKVEKILIKEIFKQQI